MSNEILNPETTPKPTSKTRRALARVTDALRGAARKPESGTIEAAYPVSDLKQEVKDLQEAGYTGYVYGGGPWLEDETRITQEWGILHPDGRVVAISIHKFYADSGHTMHSSPYRQDYPDGTSYQAHTEHFKLSLSTERPLTDLLGKDNE